MVGGWIGWWVARAMAETEKSEGGVGGLSAIESLHNPLSVGANTPKVFRKYHIVIRVPCWSG